jgi:Ca2+-binding EF-hand superfamily protein
MIKIHEMVYWRWLEELKEVVITSIGDNENKKKLSKILKEMKEYHDGQTAITSIKNKS